MPIFRDRKAQRMDRAETWGKLAGGRWPGMSQCYGTLRIQALGAAGLTHGRICGSVQAQQ